MEHGLKFSECVEICIQNGWTEPDVRLDLSAVDMARKLLIIARMLGSEANLQDLEVIWLLLVFFVFF